MATGLSDLLQRLRAKLAGLCTPQGAFAALALLVVLVLFYWPARASLAPIVGDHSWRQSLTYSVAHNFIDESPNFFFPRHDWRGDSSGISGSEPPVYAYALSILMRVFGDDAAVGRVSTWLLFVLSMVIAWRMLRREGFGAEPWLFVLACAFSPIALCDFKQIQPDPACASLALIAAAVLRRSALEGGRASFAAGLALYTASVLVKPIALAVGPAMLLFANLGARNPTRVRWVWTALAFSIPLVLWGAWHAWAEHLTRTYAGGHHLISIELVPDEVARNLRSASDWNHIVLFLLPAYVSNWWLAPAVLTGLALGFGPRDRVLSLSFLVWTLGMLLAAGAFSSRLRNNWYYCLLFLAPVAYFTAIGLAALVRVIRDPKNARPSALAAAIFLVLALVLGALRAPATQGGFFAANGPELGFWSHSTVWFDRTGSVLLLGIAAFALVLGVGAAHASARIFGYGRWVIVPVLCWSAKDAAVDAIQAVRSRSAESKWAHTRRMVEEARALAARYSRRDELFFVTHDDPVVFYRMLRRGFAQPLYIAAQQSRAYYAERGVRFGMHYSDLEAPPEWLAALPVIAQGQYTTLYCIDPKGCAELY